VVFGRQNVSRFALHFGANRTLSAGLLRFVAPRLIQQTRRGDDVKAKAKTLRSDASRQGQAEERGPSLESRRFDKRQAK
jgi:hypothetical protein